MDTHESKTMILSCILTVLALLFININAFAQFELPEVNMEVENAVPFDQAMQVALDKAESLWGQVAQGEAFPCCDDNGDLVAYMVPFAIGVDKFPNFHEIFNRIKVGRSAFDEVTKKLRGMQQRSLQGTSQGQTAAQVSTAQQVAPQQAAPDSVSIQAFEDRFGPPMNCEEARVLSTVDGDETGRFNDLRAARTLAKQIKYGVDEFGTVFVSARYDRFPVPLSSHYLSPFFSVGDLAVQRARQELGRQDVRLSRYYFLGRARGQYFEFSAGDDRVLLEAYQLEPKTREKVLIFTGRKSRPSGEMLNDLTGAWEKASAPNLGGGKKGGPDGEHTVHCPHLVPDIDWCRGCGPTSAAMAIGYWDNYEGSSTYNGYGRLIDSWCHLSKYYDGTGPIINVPILVEQLRIAFHTTLEGGTGSSKYVPGIEQVCNLGNGYSFTSQQHLSTGGDWNWPEITKEIDENRPFIWGVGDEIGEPGHDVCAWGYTDDKYVITYSTWGQGRDDWYYKEYDNESDLEYSFVLTVEPGGSTFPHHMVLGGPDGGEDLVGGIPCEITWYQFGDKIAHVDLHYSTDSGVIWQAIENSVPSMPNGWNSYTWTPPNITNFDMRVRVTAFDSVANYIAGDGSYTDFAVYEGCDLRDDGTGFQSFCPTMAVSGLGESFMAECDIRNAGAMESGTFKVKFYASTDKKITAFDHYIGTVSMPSIPSADYRDCVFTGNLPQDLPEGEYYIGWIIDADNEVVESNEKNNNVYKERPKLTVEPGPVPDIKANGQDYSLSVPEGTPVSIKPSVDPKGMKGMLGDFYIYAKHNDAKTYSWILPEETWVIVKQPELSKQLVLTPMTVTDICFKKLPKGEWEFFFSVDKGDGKLQGTYEDSVKVTVY